MENAEEPTPTRKRNANYPLAFKRHLAQRACDENVSVAQLALEHGLNTNMVYQLRELLVQAYGDDIAALQQVATVRPTSIACTGADPPF